MPSCGGACDGCSHVCLKKKLDIRQTLQSDGSLWYSPTSLQDCLLLLGKYKASGSVRLIAGDTGKGNPKNH